MPVAEKGSRNWAEKKSLWGTTDCSKVCGLSGTLTASTPGFAAWSADVSTSLIEETFRWNKDGGNLILERWGNKCWPIPLQGLRRDIEINFKTFNTYGSVAQWMSAWLWICRTLVQFTVREIFSLKFLLKRKWTKRWRTRTTHVIPWSLANGRRQKQFLESRKGAQYPSGQRRCLRKRKYRNIPGSPPRPGGNKLQFRFIEGNWTDSIKL